MGVRAVKWRPSTTTPGVKGQPGIQLQIQFSREGQLCLCGSRGQGNINFLKKRAFGMRENGQAVVSIRRLIYLESCRAVASGCVNSLLSVGL